jgi:hypothetical protein
MDHEVDRQALAVPVADGVCARARLGLAGRGDPQLHVVVGERAGTEPGELGPAQHDPDHLRRQVVLFDYLDASGDSLRHKRVRVA